MTPHLSGKFALRCCVVKSRPVFVLHSVCCSRDSDPYCSLLSICLSSVLFLYFGRRKNRASADRTLFAPPPRLDFDRLGSKAKENEKLLRAKRPRGIFLPPFTKPFIFPPLSTAQKTKAFCCRSLHFSLLQPLAILLFLLLDSINRTTRL